MLVHSAWFSSTFLRVVKFLQIKKEKSNFWGEPILQKVWIICPPPLLYFNFKTFKDPNSLPFITFQCVLYDSEAFLSEFWNFFKLKRGCLISGGIQFCRMSELFGSLLLYFNFKSFVDQNSSSFIKFQCILHDLGALFSEFWNFYKCNMGT